MLGWTKWAIALAIAGLAMGGAAPAIAGDTSVPVQRLGSPDVEARREALLKQMLARPNDLDLAFEYATLSSQVGDYEGAVSTLERMLIYAPNTCRSTRRARRTSSSSSASMPTRRPVFSEAPSLSEPARLPSPHPCQAAGGHQY